MVRARPRGSAVEEDGFRVIDFDVKPDVPCRRLGSFDSTPESLPVKTSILIWNTWKLEIRTSHRVAAGIENESYMVSGTQYGAGRRTARRLTDGITDVGFQLIWGEDEPFLHKESTLLLNGNSTTPLTAPTATECVAGPDVAVVVHVEVFDHDDVGVPVGFVYDE